MSGQKMKPPRCRGSAVFLESLEQRVHLSAAPAYFTPGQTTLETGQTPVVQKAITALFQDLLHRAPDPTSLNYFTGMFNGFTGVQAVARFITNTDEYLGDQVNALYLRFLNRPADPAGLANSINILRTSGTPVQIAANLATSAEFVAQADGNSTTLVDSLYQDFLNRAPSDSELSYYLDKLNQGAPPAALAWTFAISPEAIGQIVNNIYEDLLSRPADSAGLSYFIHGFSTTMSLQIAVSQIIGSNEYITTKIDPRGDPNQIWFTTMYEDLVYRAPTAAELAVWVPMLDNGFPRRDTIIAMQKTTDYQQARVTNIYHQLLHRDPDPSGLALFTSFIAGGGSERQVMEMIAASNEYFQNRGGGTQAGFINALESDMTNNSPANLASLAPKLTEIFAAQPLSTALAYAAQNIILASASSQERVEEIYQRLTGQPGPADAVAAYTADLDNWVDEYQQIIKEVGASDYFYDQL